MEQRAQMMEYPRAKLQRGHLHLNSSDCVVR